MVGVDVEHQEPADGAGDDADIGCGPPSPPSVDLVVVDDLVVGPGNAWVLADTPAGFAFRAAASIRGRFMQRGDPPATRYIVMDLLDRGQHAVPGRMDLHD